MANSRNQEIDTTYLSIENATERGFLHRDYIAHCFRWSHIIKYLNQNNRYKDARILDVGCGKEIPLAKSLYSSRMGPAAYVGMDVRELEWPWGSSTWKPTKLLSEFDAAEMNVSDIGFIPTVITCFEMLEHVEPVHCRKILKAMKRVSDAETIIFLSTPCYNPKVGAAGNHVNEMTYQAFGALLEDMHFTINGNWGTFASIADYTPALKKNQELSNIFDILREYYDTNCLSTIFAPLFPQYSRNCLWMLSNVDNRMSNLWGTRKFPKLIDVPRPWGSSAKEHELLAL